MEKKENQHELIRPLLTLNDLIRMIRNHPDVAQVIVILHDDHEEYSIKHVVPNAKINE